MNKRNINLDLVRVIAVLSVLFVHFFKQCGYYNQPVLGEKMYIATVMRQSFMICVPLFMMLTGYLMNKKQLSWHYFKGIKRVLITYVLSTICILLYKMIWLKENIRVLDGILNITSYDQYSWYIEMYIGLFLLIPFLNVLYHNLHTQKEKKILLLIFVILTTLPTVINNYIPIVPDYWVELYPFLYYYLGAYLSEYGSETKLSLPKNFILMVLAIIASGTYCYWKSYGTLFVWGKWCDWGGFTNVITTLLVFLFLVRVDVNSWPDIVNKTVRRISEVSLSIYLLSWIFDNYAYSILNSSIENMTERIIYIFVVVPFVFVCSFALACVIDYIYKILFKRRMV